MYVTYHLIFGKKKVWSENEVARLGELVKETVYGSIQTAEDRKQALRKIRDTLNAEFKQYGGFLAASLLLKGVSLTLVMRVNQTETEQ